MTMNALRFVEKGAIENLRLARIPKPTLAAGEALIRVKAAGINGSDAVGVQGWIPTTTVPRVPGRDWSGVVEDIASDQGASNSKDWLGASVWGSGGDRGFSYDGAYAEYIKVPLATLSRKPNKLDHAQAASIGLSWICAWIAVETLAKVKAGEKVLVIGARGAIGSSAVELCSARGASAIGTYRATPTKLPSGVTPIDLGKGSISEQVKSLGLFGKVDVLLDCAGYEEPLNDALPCMKSDGTGRVVVMAVHQRDGRLNLDLRSFYTRALTLKGLKSSVLGPEEVKEVLNYVAKGFDDGVFTLPALPKEVKMEDEGSVHAALHEVLTRSAPTRTVIIP